MKELFARVRAVALCVVTLQSMMSGASAETRPMALEDILKVREVERIALSADGESVAYVVSVPRNVLDGEENGLPKHRLYITGGAGNGRLVAESSKDFPALHWMNNGDLAFIASLETGEKAALYAASPDDVMVREVYAFDTAITDFALLPDDDTLSFIAEGKEDP